ncbi:MAG TPA: hypothetical protein VFS20_11780 [Longimicrobium sp.]|nr:hypothetical protein [Longimicrobium sp.]
MSGAPSDEVLRAAVRTAVQSSSQRVVAEQIGLTHRGLAKFMDGSSPRENTRRKLREWYVREATAHAGPDEATARAAIDVLLRGLPESAKNRATAGLIEYVQEVFRAAKMDPPEWTRKAE